MKTKVIFIIVVINIALCLSGCKENNIQDQKIVTTPEIESSVEDEVVEEENLDTVENNKQMIMDTLTDVKDKYIQEVAAELQTLGIGELTLVEGIEHNEKGYLVIRVTNTEDKKYCISLDEDGMLGLIWEDGNEDDILYGPVD